MRYLFSRRFVRGTLLAGLLAGGVCLALARAGTARAGGQVTNCTNQTQLAAMVSSGGPVTFNCGPAPVVITITTVGCLVPAANTTIDGSNQGSRVTLSGGTSNRIFRVNAGAGLTLIHLTLADGNASSLGGGDPYPNQGGAILNNGGTLVLGDVTIRGSKASLAGGAIEDAGGATLVTDSLIEDNQSDYGGGIDSIGALTLLNSIVRNNQATVHDGGGLDVGGTVVISRSQVLGNSANGAGGGLNATSTAQVSISSSRLDANTVPTYTPAFGGAIQNHGMLTVAQSTLAGNAAFEGGGISNFGAVSVFSSTLSGNWALYGGGIYNLDSAATLASSTLSANMSGGEGGGIFNTGGALTLTNSTLNGNSAANANGGGGIFHFASLVTQTLNIENSIVANSPSGGNCYQHQPGDGGGTIVSFGYNLSSDYSCTDYLIQSTDLPPGTDPNLGPLANNGGPTQTHLPLAPDSPGIDRIPKYTNGCGTTSDQRGAPRPINFKCDIGAVEYGAAFPWIYLPLIRR